MAFFRDCGLFSNSSEFFLKKRRKMNEKNSRNSDFWAGFFLGGIVGGLITLLFTTKAGEEIRERIAEEGEEWIDQVLDSLEEITKGLEEKTKEIKKAAGEKLKEELNQPLKEIASLKARIEKKKRPRRFFKKSSA